MAAAFAQLHAPWIRTFNPDTRLGLGEAVEVERHIATEPDKAGYFRFRLDDAIP